MKLLGSPAPAGIPPGRILTAHRVDSLCTCHGPAAGVRTPGHDYVVVGCSRRPEDVLIPVINQCVLLAHRP